MITDEQMRRLRRAGRSEALAGRFELGTEAGRGGMGIVYRARDLVGNGAVAVKILTGEPGADVARFLREAELLERLTHPRIVRYLAHGRTEEGEPYLVMEWLEGESLGERLRRGVLSNDDTITLGLGVCEALEVAHAAGIVHRDLKPANLLLPGGALEQVKLLDFGIARDLTAAQGATASGVLLGTAGYLAPEQARNSKRVDARADLFSLGCVLYRARAGVSPFGAENMLEALARVLTEEPAPLRTIAPDTSAALARVVRLLLSREPDERPPDAAEVRRLLEAARHDPGVDELAPTQATPRPSPSSAGPTSRFPWAGLVGATAASAAAITLVIALAPQPSPPVEPAAVPSTPPSSPAPAPCQAWAELLASMQSEDGGFGVERHREPSGWATAQALTALGRASSCAVGTQAALERGLAALEPFVTEEGTSARGVGSPVETGATAWTVLAWLASGRPDLVEAARALGPSLRRAERPDGFCLTPDCVERSAYVSVLSVWALAELAGRGEEAAPTEWLLGALSSPESEVLRIDGLAEQAYVVLESTVGAPASVRASMADRVIRVCALDAGLCTRGPGTIGETYLDHLEGRGPNLVTFWFPWSLSAVTQLERVPLDPERAAGVRGVAAAHRARIADGLELLDAAPVYEVAEFLLGASMQSSARDP